MGQLFARSVLVLALLFGLLFAVGAGVLYYYHMPVTFAIGLAVFVVVLQYLIGPYLIDWIFKIRWTTPEEISPQFAQFLRELCGKRRIRVPRFGIIEDGNPNAFTYGHVPGDARLVVTRGVVQMLEEHEFNAVVAHEVGHIRHYDFIVMSMAAIVPLVLYMIYRWTAGERKGGATAVAIGAYIAYFVSQYIVLFLSRIREYYADQHAAYSVGSANSISTALIKIAYGLARIPQEDLDAQGKKAKKPAFQPSHLMGSLGICGISSATPMALYSTNSSGQFSMDTMARAMQWDLWNPWAKFFEIQSTHPLVAHRVMAASRIAELKREVPLIPTGGFAKQNYWTEFFIDLVFLMLPYIGVITAVVGLVALAHTVGVSALLNDAALGDAARKAALTVGYGLTVAGIGWMLRLGYSYGNQYKRAKIADLVGEVAVSHIRSIPVEVEGQIIGRGVPGLFWSKDLVMQDDTGFVALIYRQPLGFIETLFGLFRAEQMVGKKGVFRGWYRRGPSPYIELEEARFEDGDGASCYYSKYLWAGAIVTTVIGGLFVMMRMF